MIQDDIDQQEPMDHYNDFVDQDDGDDGEGEDDEGMDVEIEFHNAFDDGEGEGMEEDGEEEDSY